MASRELIFLLWVTTAFTLWLLLPNIFPYVHLDDDHCQQEDILKGVLDFLTHSPRNLGQNDDGDYTTMRWDDVISGMENSLSDVRKIQKRTGEASLSNCAQKKKSPHNTF